MEEVLLPQSVMVGSHTHFFNIVPRKLFRYKTQTKEKKTNIINKPIDTL